MIFLTIGSHEPFDRLVSALDSWAGTSGQGGQIFGQITSRANHIPQYFEHVATLDPDDYNRRCAEAALIVSHVGMGTILTALSTGTPALLLPRRGHLGETRNDHQLATARHLGDRRGLYIADTEDDLPDLLDSLTAKSGEAVPPEGLSPVADPRLTSALRDFIFKGQS